jgi:hypothetical protein
MQQLQSDLIQDLTRVQLEADPILQAEYIKDLLKLVGDIRAGTYSTPESLVALSRRLGEIADNATTSDDVTTSDDATTEGDC